LTVAVPNEHDVVEILELDEVHHVGYVGLEVNLGRGEVYSLTEAGEGDGVGVVASISQPTGDGLPTPAAQPSATDLHVSCHLQDLLIDQSTRLSQTLSSTKQFLRGFSWL
jgi:hypothetical protein